jgi:hypothetical protein
MWLLGVEKIMYLLLKMERDISEPNMIYPVLGSVLCEGKVLDSAFIETVVKLEEDTKAYFCEDPVCIPWDNVIARKAIIRGVGEATGYEEFLDRGMGKLNNSRAVFLGDRDQTGTCSENGIFRVSRAPVWLDYVRCFVIQVDQHSLRKLFCT